jgi:DNA-binding GntR family transcriptional regulator
MHIQSVITNMTRRSIEIANALEKDILCGLIAVGELINEVALAERFGVSRTPVREALLSLSSLGLVRLEPGRGAVVVGISLQQVFDSYEVLSELSGLAAALCAQRMSALERAQLQSLHEQMGRHRQDGEREVYEGLDRQFHDLIVKGSGNAVLAQHIAMCAKTIAAVRHASIESHASLDAMYDEHVAVVGAILARDGDAARQAMSGHLHLRGDVASRLVATWRVHTQGAEAQA